jgi:hypothetical protein
MSTPAKLFPRFTGCLQKVLNEIKFSLLKFLDLACGHFAVMLINFIQFVSCCNVVEEFFTCQGKCAEKET